MEKKHSGDAARGESWWVVHQHHDVEVVKASDRPNTTPERGERMKKAWGPYKSQAEAKERADRIESKTTRTMRAKAGK